MNDLKAFIIRNRTPLLVITLAVAAVCWFLGNSFMNLIHNKMELNRLTKETALLDKQYENLQQKLELLKKQDPVYLERTARVQYHMSAPGETEFRFNKK